MEEIIPSKNGLPPKRDSYSSEEKALIVITTAELGVKKVAKTYGMSWHRIAAWKGNYGIQVKFKRQETPCIISSLLMEERLL